MLLAYFINIFYKTPQGYRREKVGAVIRADAEVLEPERLKKEVVDEMVAAIAKHGDSSR